MSVFKACDVRGVYPGELDSVLAGDLGRAVGTALSGGRVVVGGDVRTSTPELKAALIAGLVEAGCRVVDLGIVPTPAFYFARRRLGVAGGVMVTASHNPARYNGFKLTLTDWPISEEELGKLAEQVAAKEFVRRPGGGVTRLEMLPEYVAYVKESLAAVRGAGGTASVAATIDPRPPLRLVLDCGNGCYCRTAPGVFAELGYDVRPLFCDEDGTFPHREPNPALAKNLVALSAAVREQGAALGVAFDGDGDRVAFVDEHGAVAPCDQVIALLARHLLERSGGGKVVYDIKCSSLVPDTVRTNGGTPLMERSGHAFIKTTLLREGALFAGEISGHFFFAALGGDDGLFAALLVADLIRTSGGSLAGLLSGLPRYLTTPDLRIPYPDHDQVELLSHLAQSLTARGDCAVSLLDGVRAEFREGWGLIRVSVTEPLLTLRFEGRDREGLESVKERFLVASPKVRDLVEPFWRAQVPA